MSGTGAGWGWGSLTPSTLGLSRPSLSSLAFPSLSEPKTRGASNPSQENRVVLKVAARGGLGK